MISLLNTHDVSVEDLTDVISKDNVISFKLLKILNSPIYRGTSPIKSVHDAVVRFGIDNLKKWVLMLSLCNALDKPEMLTRITLERALMCKYYAEEIGNDIPSSSAYTVGLLSNLDAFLDQPLEKLLESVNLASFINEALLSHEGPLGEILDIVIAYQRGSLSVSNVLMPIWCRPQELHKNDMR